MMLPCEANGLQSAPFPAPLKLFSPCFPSSGEAADVSGGPERPFPRSWLAHIVLHFAIPQLRSSLGSRGVTLPCTPQCCARNEGSANRRAAQPAEFGGGERERGASGKVQNGSQHKKRVKKNLLPVHIFCHLGEQ